MEFFVSKISSILLTPSNFFLLLLVFGLLFKRRFWGQKILSFCIFLLLAVAILPLGSWLAAPLENRFPSPQLPKHIDGIIVLGGTILINTSVGRPQPSLDQKAERLIVFSDLLRRYPQAKGIFSGGSGSLITPQEKEANLAKRVLEELGIPSQRVLFETESRNTFENVRLSYQMLPPKPQEKWILVTSAMHMPRAMGLFRHLGWNVIPYPCDYQTPQPIHFNLNLDLPASLYLLDKTTHEYIALLTYYLTGKIDTLFPAP